MHGGHEEAPIAIAVGSEDEVVLAGVMYRLLSVVGAESARETCDGGISLHRRQESSSTTVSSIAGLVS
jgi:hypothetical protein